MTDTELNSKLAKWCWPNISYPENAPNFCSSLDAQVEYLWPKLDNIFRIYVFAGGWVCEMLKVEDAVEYYGEAATPALACALAVEKLIDAEVSHSLRR